MELISVFSVLKKTVVKLCIKFENNKFRFDVNGEVMTKVTKNSNVKIKGMLFRYTMNNRYETNMLLAQFI